MVRILMKEQNNTVPKEKPVQGLHHMHTINKINSIGGRLAG